MKIALAQINTKVGDLEGNLCNVKAFTEKAMVADAQLVVFPELTLLGYPVEDLLHRRTFVKKSQQNLEEVKKISERISIILGFVSDNLSREGKPYHNSAVFLHEGKIKLIQNKTLLPTYDVFDETRYFEPSDEWNVIRKGNFRFGLTICEDLWNDKEFWKTKFYHQDPVEKLVAKGCDIIINISGSPFHRGKRKLKEELFKSLAKKYQLVIVYCNLVGGNDSLIFDGGSCIINSKGDYLARASCFKEELLLFDFETLKGNMADWVNCEEEDIQEALTLGLYDFIRKSGMKKAVIGISGGIDSAVVACLAVRALGADNVLGVAMPSCYSSEGSVTDAKKLCENLNIKLIIIPITDIYFKYKKSLRKCFKGLNEDVTEENIQARIRGNILMALSNKFGHLVLNTGNKSELAVGYCTLYGDMTGGLSVIGDLPKTMVYRLAEFINRNKEIIPEPILSKPPSAELKPDQRDQDTLPSYEILDRILDAFIENHLEEDEIVNMGIDRNIVRDVLYKIDRSEYKRKQAPPGLKVSSKAFSVGRKFPIIQGWR